jgi:hypothetical protein
MQDRDQSDVYRIGRPLAERYKMESSDSKDSAEKIGLISVSRNLTAS